MGRMFLKRIKSILHAITTGFSYFDTGCIFMLKKVYKFSHIQM
jgi:hypothetical protein